MKKHAFIYIEALTILLGMKSSLNRMSNHPLFHFLRKNKKIGHDICHIYHRVLKQPDSQ